MTGSQKGLRNPEEYTYIGKYAINVKNFLSRMIEDDNGCHVWQSGRHRQGYGMFNVYNTAVNERQMNVAHRIAMIIALNRELGRDEFVMHDCENPLCCNPAHLKVGDAIERNRLSYERGNRPTVFRGPSQVKKQNRKYKWTEEQMRYIKTHTTPEIAEHFKLTKNQASRLKHRITNGYKWLD